MPKQDSTIRSRELGEGLRAAMERAGLNGKQIARELGWSESLVSMILNGKRNASEVDIAAFLGVCRVKGERRERLRCAASRTLPAGSSRTAPGCPSSSSP
jgi:transcriptional regulator with XRE-family HTH domain